MRSAIFGKRHTDGEDVALQELEVHLDTEERQFLRNAEAVHSLRHVEAFVHMDFPTRKRRRVTFVEQAIISKQSGGVWIGVVDESNGHCLLLDYKTKCPITKYRA